MERTLDPAQLETTSTGSTGRRGRSAARARMPRTSAGDVRAPARPPAPTPQRGRLGYLLRALRNTFLNQNRPRAADYVPARYPTLDLVADPHAVQPEAALEAAELYAAISAFPGDFRDVLVAVDVTGLSYKEAARALRIREGTVMSRLYRARQQVVRRVEGGTTSGTTHPISRRCRRVRRAPSRQTRSDLRRPARA